MKASAPRRWPARRAATALLGIVALLAGCATEPISLQVRPETDRPIARIDARVAFVHPQAFRERQEDVSAYGNKYILHLKVGEASDKALREVYPRLFVAPREVASRQAFSQLAGADAPAVLLEPSIVALHYLNASRRMHGPCYSQIEYRFSLTNAQGETVTWIVRGFGAFDLEEEARLAQKGLATLPRGEEGILVEAPRRAVEAGVANLARSFDRVPELIRFSGKPIAGTDVAAERQVTGEIGPPTPGVEAAYPGALTLLVQRTPLPTPPSGIAEMGSAEPDLIAVRITLRNESTRRLALDPADIEWQAGLAAPIEAIPPPVAAALLTRLPFGITVAPGVGVAALPSLFAALVSAAELERHRTEFSAWTAAVSRDTLTDGITGGGETRTGLAYFPKPGKLSGGTLTVRVIDLDDAARYTVRVSMPAS